MELRIVLLILLVVSRGRANKSNGCDLCLHGVCYEQNRLLSNFNISVNPVIAVDRTDNILYFEDYDDSTLKFLNLDDNSVQSTNIRHINALAVDQKTQTLFVNSWDGLLSKYHPETNHSISHNTGKRFSSLYYKGRLHAWIGTKVYTESLFQLTELEPLKHLDVSELILDKRGDYYFCGCSQNIICHTYKLNVRSNFPFVFSNNLYFLATDKDDNAYFIDSYRTARKRLIYIYRLNYSTNVLEEVGLFDPMYNREILDVQFDRDNNLIIIQQRNKYNDGDDEYEDNNDRIYHMKPSPRSCKIRKQPFNEFIIAREAAIDVLNSFFNFFL